MANRVIPKKPDRVVLHSSIDRFYQCDHGSADRLRDVLDVQPR